MKYKCKKCMELKSAFHKEMKDIKDMSVDELMKEHERLYNDLCRGIGDSKDTLNMLLELERQLTIEELTPRNE